MLRRSLSLAALALLTLTMGAVAPESLGPPWISIEYPPSPYDATTRDAFLLVHTFHHGTPIVAPITGKAEGMVSGKRQSVSLKFDRTSRTGVYALNKQWSSNGSWVLFITANQGPDDDVTAVVELAADGQVVAVRVPTERRGSWKVPADVSSADRESILRARVAANTGEKGTVAARRAPR
jgi:hypothetical protein